MRVFGTSLETALRSPEAYAYGLIQIGPFAYDNYVFAATTASHDIVMGGVTFVKASPIIKLDPPRLSPSVDREVYKIHLSDPEYSFRERLEGGAFGTPVSVKATIGVPNFNANAGVFRAESVVTEALVTAYKGTLDSYMYNISPEGDVVLELICTSPMGALGLTRAILTSPNWMRQRYPGDNSFDQVSEGSRQIALLWGRTQA
jgi:hypothetical protein